MLCFYIISWLHCKLRSLYGAIFPLIEQCFSYDKCGCPDSSNYPQEVMVNKFKRLIKLDLKCDHINCRLIEEQIQTIQHDVTSLKRINYIYREIFYFSMVMCLCLQIKYCFYKSLLGVLHNWFMGDSALTHGDLWVVSQIYDFFMKNYINMQRPE